MELVSSLSSREIMRVIEQDYGTAIYRAHMAQGKLPPQKRQRVKLSQLFSLKETAYLCVFKRQDGSYEWHHFELDANKRTLIVWDQWLTKGPKIFEGGYEMDGDHLKINWKVCE